MAMQDDAIFILGSGRCGSTAVQRALSMEGGIWIWGEHDGILRELLEWPKHVERSNLLQQLSFTRRAISPLSIMNDAANGEANDLAWLNGFNVTDINIGIGQMISFLFTRGLPPGKDRWGFKEIRYGYKDNVPELLLSLFPRSKIVHLARQPVPTIISSIAAWNTSLYSKAKDDHAAIRQLFLDYGTRWLTITRYLCQLRLRYPSRVFCLRLEDYCNQKAALFHFLSISGAIDVAEDAGGLKVVNSIIGPHDSSRDSVFKELAAEFESEFRDLSMLCGYGV